MFALCNWLVLQPFVVRSVEARVFFDSDYPCTQCRILFPESSAIPSPVIKVLNENVGKWIENRFKDYERAGFVELVFRTFMKWFDRNMEAFFTRGLEEELLLRKRENDVICAFAAAKVASRRLSSEDNQEDRTAPIDASAPTDSVGDSEAAQEHGSVNDVAFAFVNLCLEKNVGTIELTSLHTIFRCNRCSGLQVLQLTPMKDVSISCVKCKQVISTKLVPEIAHENSPIFGRLRLLNASVFDLSLSESKFDLCCLNCSAKQSLSGITAENTETRWCRSCFAKIRLTIGGVRSTSGQSRHPRLDASAISSLSRRRSPNRVTLKPGTALPLQGTCKHFKKSYRWFRFPCCNHLYPCDECHAENEDHESKLANRIVCGFCSNEQRCMGEKECIYCKHSMVKTATGHWEGGKGCREKTVMSTKDTAKYRGMAKTQPKRKGEKARQQK
uniref:CHY-type domain-containing protein n=1 Tax=Trichuris muris TaxID=70415 RepID=A0A5S6Q8W9_TRIMR